METQTAQKKLRPPQLNQFIGCGRVVADSPAKTLPGGSTVLNFRMAIPNRFKGKDGAWKDNPFFLGVTLWNKAAEYANGKAMKGVPVVVEGRLENREYQAQDGTKRQIVNLVASRAQFIEKRMGPSQEQYEDVPGGDFTNQKEEPEYDGP